MFEELFSQVSKLSKQDIRLLTKYVQAPTKFSDPDGKFQDISTRIKTLYVGYEWTEAFWLSRHASIESPKCPGCDTRLTFNAETYSYKKFCSSSCRHTVIGNPFAEKLLIDGNVYNSLNDAQRELGISRVELRRRLFSPKFPTYQFQNNHEKTCIDYISKIDPSLVSPNILSEWKESRTTVGALVKRYNVHPETFSVVFAYHDIDTTFDQVHDVAKQYRDDKERLASLYETMTTDEIASLIQVSPKAVQIWLKNHRIPIDQTKSQSKIEREVIDFITTLRPDLTIVARDRSALNGMEIDVYLPDLKVGFEFNGLFWHSESPLSKTARSRHSMKQKVAYKNGIKLYQFFDVHESSSTQRKPIVFSMIRNAIGASDKIYARKCQVAKVTPSEGTQFFKDNHIAGSRGASVYYGLYHAGKLISCMSFGTPLKRKNQYTWEIVRFASILNITVIGGASKLFKTFLANHSGDVMTYADLRFGNGNVYQQLGFSYVERTSENYFYTDMKVVYSRYQFQKNNIQRHCDVYDANLTEFENADVNNYRIFYDCGSLVYDYVR